MTSSQKTQRQRQRQTPLPHNTYSIDFDDTSSHWPPITDRSNETPTQRNERLEREREAKRINDEIDAQIEIEKSGRRRQDFKILLVGQAESGKSTILRNLKLKYAPSAFRAEMAAWRAVIDLKLVRSVIFLLNLLEERSPITTTSTADAASGDGGSVNTGSTDDLGSLRVRLSPLRSIEESLARSISPGHHPQRVGSPDSICNSSVAVPTEGAFEVSARSDLRWGTFSKGSAGGSAKARSQDFEEVQKNARRAVEACRGDIVALWNHPAVRASLADQSISLECQSGFFLDAVDRITTPGYEPSPTDIVKARAQAVGGIEEHLLRLETKQVQDQDGDSLAREHGELLSFIKVGGSLASRAWLPFFDGVNMVLFIAPVSAFNQTLTEDRRVNRLEDSLLSWRSLCGHNLLRQATFVLLLNKLDLLDAKLKSGIQFQQFVTSYKDRPNTTESVLEYLKGRFRAIYQHNLQNVSLHVHVTCAADSYSSSIVIKIVRDVITRENLKRANLC